MRNRRVLIFLTFVNENYSNIDYKKGNIVEDNDGMVTLIISDSYIDSVGNSFYGNEEVYEPYDDNYSHISVYKSIADKKGYDIIIMMDMMKMVIK